MSHGNYSAKRFVPSSLNFYHKIWGRWWYLAHCTSEETKASVNKYLVRGLIARKELVQPAAVIQAAYMEGLLAKDKLVHISQSESF